MCVARRESELVVDLDEVAERVASANLRNDAALGCVDRSFD